MAAPPPASDTAAPDAILRLPPALDLLSAATLQDRLQDRLNHGLPLVIDAAEVERLGTPCLQLLIAASREAQASGLGFRIEAASTPFRAAIADLGLSAALPVTCEDPAHG